MTELIQKFTIDEKIAKNSIEMFSYNHKFSVKMEVVMTVNFVPHSPLTQNDISRMPKNMIMAGTTARVADSYSGNKKKSSFWGTVFNIALAAGAVVALKRLGQNTFLKVADPNNIKFLDKIKTGIVKAGTLIETPFIKGYSYIKGLVAKGSTKA